MKICFFSFIFISWRLINIHSLPSHNNPVSLDAIIICISHIRNQRHREVFQQDHLISRRAWIWTQVVWLKNWCSYPLHYAAALYFYSETSLNSMQFIYKLINSRYICFFKFITRTHLFVMLIDEPQMPDH